eukprot:4046684-Prymnesium_polylepis.1
MLLDKLQVGAGVARTALSSLPDTAETPHAPLPRSRICLLIRSSLRARRWSSTSTVGTSSRSRPRSRSRRSAIHRRSARRRVAARAVPSWLAV